MESNLFPEQPQCLTLLGPKILENTPKLTPERDSSTCHMCTSPRPPPGSILVHAVEL